MYFGMGMSYGWRSFQKCVHHKKCLTFLALGPYPHPIPVMSKNKFKKSENWKCVQADLTQMESS